MEKIELKVRQKTVEILPLYDLHYGSEECNEKLINGIIKYIRHHNNCFTFLGGDLIECAVYGSKGSVHSQKHQVNEQIEHIVNLLKPIRNKILFSVYGNHEYRVEKSTGVNVSKIIADQLDIPFVGWECHFSININSKLCRCYAHHGCGAGGTSGAKVNSLERLHWRSPYAHVIFSGHSHFPVNTEKEIRYLTSKSTLRAFTQHFVSCGSTHGSDGYAAMKALSPIHTSQNIVTLRSWNDEFDIDIKRFKIP